MKTVVIYHRADFDGLFSCEIARRFFGDNADYIGWDYGDPLPVIEQGSPLYMIDISVDGLMDWPGLVWIDHHVSAIEKYAFPIHGYRIDGVAACRLAWQWFNNPLGPMSPHTHLSDAKLPDKAAYFHRLVEEPLAVRLAGEYDIWDKRDPRAELFQHGLRSRELTPSWWAQLLHKFTSDATVALLLQRGEVLQYARERENSSVIKRQGFTVDWEGLCFIACNAARFNSLLFTAALQPEHDACLGFAYDGGKKKWKVSLYGVPGKPDIDLRTIASRHGGGGHKQACGFECHALPFELPKA